MLCVIKRLAAALFLIILPLNIYFGLTAAAEENNTNPGQNALPQISLSMADATVPYTPEGYTPLAEVNGAGVNGVEIKYEVTDSKGTAVPVPVKAAGSYTVRAYIENGGTPSAFCTALLTVEKAKVCIVTRYAVAAHTAMDNPVEYSIYPEWAAELVKVKTSYRAIESLSDPGTAVDAPRDPGKYLVRMEAEVKSENISCAGKYLIYEIAENQGEALSDAEAKRSVPSEFYAEVESIDALYLERSMVPEYTVNAAGVESRLMYSLLYANGAFGEYTDTPPSEPGDYIAACFVLDTVIGRGRIIIGKLTPRIKMDDLWVTYTPEGVQPPAAAVTPQGIEISYKAYAYEEGMAGNSVSFPLRDCGTYLISAFPSDASRYSFHAEYCFIYITPAQPEIQAKNTVFTADGSQKQLPVSVLPEWAEYAVEYFALDGDTAVALEGAPREPGEYYAAVAVKGGRNIGSMTRIYGLRITADNPTVIKALDITLKALCLCVSAAAMVLGCVQIRRAKRVNNSKENLI